MFKYFSAFVVGYLGLAKYLRNRRTDKLTKSLGYENLTTSEIYETISLSDAHRIMLNMVLFEFPKFFEVSLEFALFRTYAIPSISELLLKTRQLADPKPAPKRYVDTSVLISEFMRWPLDSERASQALARMNFLHAQYPSIRPCDTLFTLLLFSTQPILFISRYEWRQPTELEKVAMWKFWTEIGIRMNIPAETIPKTWEAMVEWSKKFEDENMIPVEANNIVSIQTVELLLYWIPNGPIKQFAKQCIYGILDEPLRTAMIFPKPHWTIPYILPAVFGTRKFFLRHLALPRIWTVEKLCPKPNPKTSLYNANITKVEPWYIAPTFWNQYGPWAWVARIGGWPVIGEGRYRAGGYEIASVGPKEFSEKGRERVLAEAEKIQMMGVGGGGGCPFR